jgi:ATP-dependent DNA helicase DinG
VPRTFVALDLETTGLNPDRDAIIEIGAIKFRDGVAIEQFTTLINPGRPIPYEVQQLTGICDADVAGKPHFREIAGQAMRFIGSLPVVGHNVSFDLAFMRAQGLLAENIGLDTWELASVLLPHQSSYSLGSLADALGLKLENAHRAFHDAQATGELYNLLCERAAALPRPVLAEIARLTQNSSWPLGRVFVELVPVAGGVRRTGDAVPLEQLAPNSPLWQPLRVGEPLAPRDEPALIDVEQLAAMLAPDGAVGRAFNGYEYRAPQVAMLEAVGQAFNEQHHLLAEAGTGTGKSLAYLLPAIAYAVANRCRVVISTNTINLQDQLYSKDLPDLQRILGAAWGREVAFRAALLKGRGNYLCPRRFNGLRSRTSLTNEELRGITRILIWLPETQTGDMSELSLPTPADRFVWGQVAADDEGCSLERCQREQGGRCFFYRARKQAEASHVVVVNHSLLMADAAAGNRVLPEYHDLIIDEAHHLENAVTEQLSFRADPALLNQQLVTLYSRAGKGSGLLADLVAMLKRGVPEELVALVREQIARVQDAVMTAHERQADFWETLADALRGLETNIDNSDYDTRVRITDNHRSQSAWVGVEVVWEKLSSAWQRLIKGLGALAEGLQDLQNGGLGPASLSNVVEALSAAERRLSELHSQMEAWAIKPDHNMIYWVEISAQDGRIGLRAAPLHVGPLVQEHILFRSNTVVMTSATLRTAGSFDYVRDRLQAREADTITVGSPFDYRESTLLYLPTDLPEPTASGYQNAVEQTLIGLARALNGRTLALFTSYAQLRRTAQAIAPTLKESHITVLSQSSGTSRHQLLEVFKRDAHTVLLGTRSFWEGVDVIGPALSALVLVRLPFAVPTDPVVAARSETFDDPFYNYSIPDAILRFRQGFGRLIRSKTDRGVVVVLDKRVQSKNYGQLFLDSLPDCTVHRAPLMNLPAKAKLWVEK